MIEQGEMIERWVNAERVLDALPQHDREKHWNMAVWGVQSECGTVACAAGHCGLDPWFRDRGFKLDFNDGDPVISSVEEFFGREGSTRIFLNCERRSVETVIGEMREHIDELRARATLTAKAPVDIGQAWAGQGGVFAGAMRGADDVDYFLILGPQHAEELNWNRASEWAAQLEVDGHRDFVLASRAEQTVLFDRVKHLFDPNYYWSGETHASDSSSAWDQDFYHGGQYGWLKYGKLRARAVRRLVIQ